MLNHLHLICLAHGLDVKRPVTVMEEAGRSRIRTQDSFHSTQGICQLSWQV